MDWPTQFIQLAKYALQREDLRHRFLHAKQAGKIFQTPGISGCLETTVVLAIYEAAIAKGFSHGRTIDYERKYPTESGENPKRADLAMKDGGKGKNWCYIEVKYYGGSGKQIPS